MKRLLNVSLLVLGVAGGLVVGASGAAAAPPVICVGESASVALEPTKLGSQAEIGGYAGVGAVTNCNELFGVVVIGKYADGTVLAVTVQLKTGGASMVGGITMFGGVGSLVLDGTVVSDAFPTDGIVAVLVSLPDADGGKPRLLARSDF